MDFAYMMRKRVPPPWSKRYLILKAMASGADSDPEQIRRLHRRLGPRSMSPTPGPENAGSLWLQSSASKLEAQSQHIHLDSTNSQPSDRISRHMEQLSAGCCGW